MTNSRRGVLWLAIAWTLIGGMMLLILCSCATEAMREGFEQCGVSAAAGDTAGVRMVSNAALTKYGRPQRICTPNTVQRTITAIQSDWSIGDVFSGGGADWLLTILGGGGIGGTLLVLLRQYLAERNKRRESDEMNTVQIRAIENMDDSQAVKSAIKEKMTNAGLQVKFDRRVQKITQT